jgi:prepilin peptidase CpaA
MAVLLLVPDAVCVLVCLIAAITDLRSRTIPNTLTFTGIGLGLLLSPIVLALAERGPTPFETAAIGLVSSVAGAMTMALAFGLIGAMNLVGGGDVKLMVAVGALLRWPQALLALVYVALAGGVIGLLYAVAKGRMGVVLRNLFTLGRRVVRPKRPSEPVELHRIPYALAILLGAVWAVLARYLPALRLP